MLALAYDQVSALQFIYSAKLMLHKHLENALLPIQYCNALQHKLYGE